MIRTPLTGPQAQSKASFLQRFTGGPRGLLFWAVWALALQALALAGALASPPEWKVYVRNLLFSSFYAEAELANQQAVDAAVAQGFKRDARNEGYLQYLEPKVAQTLKAYQAATRPSDRELAQAIATRLGDPRESKICGIESLNRMVFDAARGQGCCSDFSKAWIFYAKYLGLTVREVNAPAHTTVEYFDRQAGRWAWLDPYNRLEIVDDSGRPYSHYQLRSMTLFDKANFRRLPGGHEDFEPQRYGGYAPSELAVISWRRGVNFLEVEAWDERLRALRLPKSLRQMVLLTAGIQPGWLVLTTNALAFYLKTLQFLAWAFLVLLATLNATLVVLVVLGVRGVWRGRGGRES